jgi:hypothetical protein
MRILLNILGLCFYGVSLYFVFTNNLPEFLNIVGGDAYNHNYKFLFSIVMSIMGTGFMIMATSYPSDLKLIQKLKDSF